MAKHEEIHCQHYSRRIWPHPDSGVWRADGRKISKGIGRPSLGVKDKAKALERLKELDHRTAIRLGKIEDTDPVKQTELLSISDGVEMYKKHAGRSRALGGVSTSTLARYRAILFKFQLFAQKKGIGCWQDISADVLTQYITQLDEDGYAYDSLDIELTTIKQVINYLRDKKNVKGLHKVEGCSVPEGEGTSRYCYSTRQVDAMVEHCMADPKLVWLGQVLVVLAHTGMRVGEVAELRWSDIKADWIHLPDNSRQGTKAHREKARSTKGKRSRKIPIHPCVAAVFDAIKRKQDGRVFHGPLGGKLKPDTVLRVFKRDVRTPLKLRFPKTSDELGFEDGVIHSFRHYFISRCADSGVDEHKLKSWVGHTDSKLIRHYYHPDKEVALAEMQRIQFMTDDSAAA